MEWKKMKRYVTAVGISGRSGQATLRPEFVVPIVKWGSRLSSSTGILSAYLGREILIKKLLPNQLSTGNQSFPALERVDIWTAVIQNTSKSLSLLVR